MSFSRSSRMALSDKRTNGSSGRVRSKKAVTKPRPFKLSSSRPRKADSENAAVADAANRRTPKSKPLPQTLQTKLLTGVQSRKQARGNLTSPAKPSTTSRIPRARRSLSSPIKTRTPKPVKREVRAVAAAAGPSRSVKKASPASAKAKASKTKTKTKTKPAQTSVVATATKAKRTARLRSAQRAVLKPSKASKQPREVFTSGGSHLFQRHRKGLGGGAGRVSMISSSRGSRAQAAPAASGRRSMIAPRTRGLLFQRNKAAVAPPALPSTAAKVQPPPLPEAINEDAEFAGEFDDFKADPGADMFLRGKPTETERLQRRQATMDNHKKRPSMYRGAARVPGRAAAKPDTNKSSHPHIASPPLRQPAAAVKEAPVLPSAVASYSILGSARKRAQTRSEHRPELAKVAASILSPGSLQDRTHNGALLPSASGRGSAAFRTRSARRTKTPRQVAKAIAALTSTQRALGESAVQLNFDAPKAAAPPVLPAPELVRVSSIVSTSSTSSAFNCVTPDADERRAGLAVALPQDEKASTSPRPVVMCRTSSLRRVPVEQDVESPEVAIAAQAAPLVDVVDRPTNPQAAFSESPCPQFSEEPSPYCRNLR